MRKATNVCTYMQDNQHIDCSLFGKQNSRQLVNVSLPWRQICLLTTFTKIKFSRNFWIYSKQDFDGTCENSRQNFDEI